MKLDDDAGILTAENGRNRIKEVKAMNLDIFPSLDFYCLQRWAMTFVESCFPGAGIDQITLREYNLWNKETPELAKAVRLRSKSHPQYLVIIHLSKQFEHQSRREELIRAVHGPTIWDDQNYLALGIGTAFLDCLKRPTISKLCDEMQRFVFWCYGAQQDEYSPETNGYNWPLHADREGDFWQLYPIVKLQLPGRQFDSKAITDYVQLSELSLDDDKKKRIESLCRGGNLKIYRNIPIIDPDAQIHDDERTEYGVHDSSDIETLIGDGSDWILKIQGDPEHCLYRSPENGFVYIAENDFHLVSVNEIDFYNHYIGLSGAIKWGLSPEPAKTHPQTEPVKSYADYLADVSGTDDTIPMFPFHIGVIKRQVARWQTDFNLSLSGAFLSSMNLLPDFIAAGIQIPYCIVLLLHQYPDRFWEIVEQIKNDIPLDHESADFIKTHKYSGTAKFLQKNRQIPNGKLLADDFILAYTQKPEYNWRDDWCIEPASPADEVPRFIEFKNRVSLLDVPVTGMMPDAQNKTIQDEKMPSEEFVKSLREDVLKIYRIICKLAGKAALDAAVTFLENNPCPYIKPEYLTEDMFPNVNKPDRAFKANIVKVAMLNKGYKPMEQTEIIRILTE